MEKEYILKTPIYIGNFEKIDLEVQGVIIIDGHSFDMKANKTRCYRKFIFNNNELGQKIDKKDFDFIENILKNKDIELPIYFEDADLYLQQFSV